MMEHIDELERRAVDRIASVRRFRHMTQQKLSEATGMRRIAITEVEAHRRHLRVGEALALCNALGVSLGDVVSEGPLTLWADLTIE